MQESFWWGQCSDRYMPPPPPLWFLWLLSITFTYINKLTLAKRTAKLQAMLKKMEEVKVGAWKEEARDVKKRTVSNL